MGTNFDSPSKGLLFNMLVVNGLHNHGGWNIIVAAHTH